MKLFLLRSWVLCCTLACCIFLSSAATADERPRLVIVVSVDQLCQEYFQRFHNSLAADGLYRTAENEGAVFTNCHHAHAFTITAPGHAVMLTGTYPHRHGIIGNDWHNPATGKKMYCVTDTSCTTIGAAVGDGPCSPKNLLVPTVGDVLKLSTNKQAKVFGVSLKDRAAILMTGALADAAYWFEESEGVWVTSSYYRNDLPGYLRAFNNPSFADRYANQEWNLSRPIEDYHIETPDDFAAENPPEGLGRTFPHKLAPAGKKLYSQLRTTPYGNEMTLAVATEVMIHEQLGQDDIPDLLCINLSSNDYVGHAFGPHSLEVEDITYRTDKMLREFLDKACEHAGKENVVLLLSADHGVCPLPELLKSKGIQHTGRDPLGGESKVKAALEVVLRQRLPHVEGNAPLIQRVEPTQLFFDRSHPALAGENFALAQQVCRDWLQEQDGVHRAVTREELLRRQANDKLADALLKTFHAKRSGDVLWVYEPYYLCGGRGTTHGSPWRYDTHVPLLLWGHGIKPGVHARRATPAMIAPTVAALLRLDSPAACEEEPLLEALARP